MMVTQKQTYNINVPNHMIFDEEIEYLDKIVISFPDYMMRMVCLVTICVGNH